MPAPSAAEDRDTGVWVVALHGRLALADAAPAGVAVERCMAGCPAAIVVDLCGLTWFETGALALLPVWHHRADRAGVPLAYVGHEDLAEQVRGGPARDFVRIHPDLAAARARVL